jgi:hypothetical protein
MHFILAPHALGTFAILLGSPPFGIVGSSGSVQGESGAAAYKRSGGRPPLLQILLVSRSYLPSITAAMLPLWLSISQRTARKGPARSNRPLFPRTACPAYRQVAR